MQNHVLHNFHSVCLFVDDELYVDEQEKSSDQQTVNSVNDAAVLEDFS